MPWKSDAQRRWGHTAAGEKALGGPAKVAEYDAASKGQDLPERVKGGKVGDRKTTDTTAGPQNPLGGAFNRTGVVETNAHPEMAAERKIAGPKEIGQQIQGAVRAVSKFVQGHMNSSGSHRSPTTISDQKH